MLPASLKRSSVDDDTLLLQEGALRCADDTQGALVDTAIVGQLSVSIVRCAMTCEAFFGIWLRRRVGRNEQSMHATFITGEQSEWGVRPTTTFVTKLVDRVRARIRGPWYREAFQEKCIDRFVAACVRNRFVVGMFLFVRCLD